MSNNARSAPIGVFDSGLGGLTVVRRLRERLPHESILYVADQAHVPYGGRELSQVCSFACGISESLVIDGCKAVVMACNISSATALPAVQLDHPSVTVLGVIAPGARAAIAQTTKGRIGVLATEGTVRSGAYSRTLAQMNPDLQITEAPCPLFVPLVEAGAVNTTDAMSACRDYLRPLQEAGVDCVILGCTHYPFLLPSLQTVAPDLVFVDPAQQTVLELAVLLEEADMLAPVSQTPSPTRLATTGDPGIFSSQLARFLPDCAQNANVVGARWDFGRLAFD